MGLCNFMQQHTHPGGVYPDVNRTTGPNRGSQTCARSAPSDGSGCVAPHSQHQAKSHASAPPPLAHATDNKIFVDAPAWYTLPIDAVYNPSNALPADRSVLPLVASWPNL